MRIAAGPLAWCRLYQNTQKRVFACVALRALPFLIWRFLWSLLALEIKPFVHAGIDRAWSKLVNIDGNFPCAARKCASIPCASVARMRTFLLRRKTSYSVRAPVWTAASAVQGNTVFRRCSSSSSVLVKVPQFRAFQGNGFHFSTPLQRLMTDSPWMALIRI